MLKQGSPNYFENQNVIVPYDRLYEACQKDPRSLRKFCRDLQAKHLLADFETDVLLAHFKVFVQARDAKA